MLMTILKMRTCQAENCKDNSSHLWSLLQGTCFLLIKGASGAEFHARRCQQPWQYLCQNVLL